jgi:6-pyruvoyltetrahydropterin/6-carboxytetrahydropterin synthase
MPESCVAQRRARIAVLVELTRVYHFSAAHQLCNPALLPAENERVYGMCAGMHGHNYYVEVTVAGAPDPVTGMVCDVAGLDRLVQREVLDHVDHHALEAVPRLRDVITTGESLARAFWRPLAAALPVGTLSRVTVVETAKNRFHYRGEES